MSSEAFKAANNKVHPVETQWHYPILTKYDFKPLTPSQTGFVRTYQYQNDAGHQITVTTGSNADYWRDDTVTGGGYWASLEPHLEQLANKG